MSGSPSGNGSPVTMCSSLTLVATALSDKNWPDCAVAAWAPRQPQLGGRGAAGAQQPRPHPPPPRMAQWKHDAKVACVTATTL
eukprot:4688623-Amphidinium_carterae.1